MSTSQDLKEFDGFTALGHAMDFLDIHLVIASGIALPFFAILLLTTEASNWPRGIVKRVQFIISEFSYILAFSVFGVVTAFFLSLALKRDASGESTNGLIESFAAPFISLLTAGAIFATSRNNAGGEKHPRIAVSAACFLCAAALSYRTFFYQILTAF